MKNILKVTGLAIALNIALPSCNKMLDPQPYGEQTIDAAFTSFSGTLLAVNGLYNPLTGGNLYRGNNGNALLFVDYASDDVVGAETASGGVSYNPLDYFELAANNQQTLDIWADLYRIIYRANLIVERVPGVPLLPSQRFNSANLPFKDQFVGEAKFMRAFAYFNLVRLFGDVPLQLTPVNSPEKVNVPRTPAAQVYTQIVEDLKAAGELLPPSYSNSGAGNELGRPTKWSARAILADVYLTQEEYGLARTTALDIINNSDRQLNPNYRDNFAGRGGTENSRESLFEVQFSSNEQTQGISPIGNNFAYIMGATTEFNGSSPSLAGYRPTDNADPSNESNFSGGLIQEYEINDIRRDVNFYQGLGSNNTVRWLTWKYHPVTMSGNPPRPSNPGSVGQTNFPLYRLAEVYLIYAEASNELGLLDETGLGYLNQLRRRAFGLPLTTPAPGVDIEPAGKSQADFRAIIRSERRKELAMENKRWFDLQRYGFDYAKDVLVEKQKRTNFTKEKLLLPIAQRELDNNPALKGQQNPGY